MTIRDIAVLLARDLAVTSLAPAQVVENAAIRGISTGQLAAIVQAINSAYYELWHKSPASMFQRRASKVLYPPTQISLDVGQYDDKVTPTGDASWMAGCTVLIDGDPRDNEFLEDTERLVRPYMGATATDVTAMVWCDAIRLRTTEEIVLDTVQIRGIGLLRGATWTGMQNITPAPHFWAAQYVNELQLNKLIGQPTDYDVEARYDQSDVLPTRTKFLRVAPKPGVAYPLDYRVMGSAPQITAEDIDLGDHEADPSKDPVVPWSPLTLYAVARQHLSADSQFINDSGRQEIMRQFKLAIDTLEHGDPKGLNSGAVWSNGVFRGSGGQFTAAFPQSANPYRQ